MKKLIFLILLGVLLVGTLQLNFVRPAGTSYCCEKTTDGAWCQNMAEESSCDENYKSAPSSCESTSYCKLGCCYDSQEGTCMENTPQVTCNDNGGTYSDESAECDIGQCQLGCCLIGDQAAFVTQTRCTKLSALYGLETDFRTDISSELSCIASAFSDVKGACVYEEDYQTTCKFITKKECLDMGAELTYNINETAEVSFHEGYLCSDESLGTVCGPTQDTTCVEGSDEVYFVDSCGNLANIYDAAKIDDASYWSAVVSKEDSCGYGVSDADSKSCGNCDYFLGSTCKKYNSGEDRVSPSYGDNICRDLACEYDGETYSHGETWCANSLGIGDNLPGSRYFRLVCYDNEVSVEPCAEYRQEICIQSEVNGFSAAACRVNMWQDCTAQGNQNDCENTDKRDCQWIEGVGLGNGSSDGSCYPLYAPGFDFWNSEGDASSLCSEASAQCTVEYEKGLGGSWEVSDNGECLTSDWENSRNSICAAIGDCGSKTNYFGVAGYINESAIIIGEREEGEPE